MVRVTASVYIRHLLTCFLNQNITFGKFEVWATQDIILGNFNKVIATLKGFYSESVNKNFYESQIKSFQTGASFTLLVAVRNSKAQHGGNIKREPTTHNISSHTFRDKHKFLVPQSLVHKL